LNSDTGGRCGVDRDTLKAVEDTGEELMRALQSLSGNLQLEQPSREGVMMVSHQFSVDEKKHDDG